MITVKRFTAPWCGPCRTLAPVMNSLQNEMPNVGFETIDVEDYPESAKEFNIRTIPAVVIIKDGVRKEIITGANPKQRYVDAINHYGD